MINILNQLNGQEIFGINGERADESWEENPGAGQRKSRLGGAILS
jgi:hypothetical protein